MIDAEHTARVEPIYPALWRVRLWLGCPIVPLGLGGALCLFTVPIGLQTRNLWWMAVGVVALIAVVFALRKLAKIDPMFFHVAARYRRYAKHFPAVGSVGAPYPMARRHQR
jgi:type IV secretory pathway TrbD component